MHYTIQLNTLLASGYDIGLKNYPIFSESYRETLNKKIIDRYRFKEIAFETPQRFIFELNSCMDRIMPYYNNLYTAYANLEEIGFEELLKKSIGSQFNGLIKNTTGEQFNETGQSTDTLGTTVTNYYDSKDITNYDSTDVNEYGDYDTASNKYINGLTTTNEQLEKSSSISLHADTPQNGVSDDLAENWGNSSFISSADKSLNLDGKNQTTQTGKTTNKKGGNDTVERKGNDKVENAGQNINDTIRNTNTNSISEETQGNITYNFDYMESFKKILDVLVNIDLKVIDELNFLFLRIY